MLAWAWALDLLQGHVGVESLVGGPHRVEVHSPEEMDVPVEEQFLPFLKDNTKTT